MGKIIVLQRTSYLDFPLQFSHNNSLFFFPSKIFPKGLPDEYAIETIFRVRRSTKKERWFLWQVLNQQNIPQVRNHRVVLISFLLCGYAR